MQIKCEPGQNGSTYRFDVAILNDNFLVSFMLQQCRLMNKRKDYIYGETIQHQCAYRNAQEFTCLKSIFRVDFVTEFLSICHSALKCGRQCRYKISNQKKVPAQKCIDKKDFVCHFDSKLIHDSFITIVSSNCAYFLTRQMR